MTSDKVHREGYWGTPHKFRRPACGSGYSWRLTTDPGEVTCQHCKQYAGLDGLLFRAPNGQREAAS